MPNLGSMGLEKTISEREKSLCVCMCVVEIGANKTFEERDQ